ncbi:hypothetical protein GCM10011385_41350 [Nitratireductor aestuarii]|uniref:Uncharacterized protein n=1 Tax=Nitratireductor aestuarii TaxID=1735103 RepID=A0A916S3Y2_9HYPH|nr:hypothetical protein GCM10011385_41350 [Nitratireductor aestuarii]
MTKQLFEGADVPRLTIPKRPLSRLALLPSCCIEINNISNGADDRALGVFKLYLDGGNVDWSRAHIAEEAARLESQPRAACDQHRGTKLPAIARDEDLQIDNPDNQGANPSYR